MDYLDKKLNKLPKAKMSFLKKARLKYQLYILVLKDTFDSSLVGALQYRLVAIGLLIAVIFGLPLYSYASPGVNRNNILYPIKEGLEKIELAAAITEEQKMEKLEKFSDRRLEEAELISTKIESKEDKEVLSSTIDKALELKNIANEISTNIVIEKTEELADKQEKNSSKQIEKLNSIASNVGINEEEDLVEKIAEAMETVSRKSLIPEIRREVFELRDLNSGRAQENIRANRNEFEEAPVSTSTEKTMEAEAVSEESRNRSRGMKSQVEINTEKKGDVQALEEQINNLKNEIREDDYDEKDVKTLFEALDKRVKDANKALEDDADKNIDSFINSTRAITNNAKQFIKKKNSKNFSNGNSGKGGR